MTAVPPCLLPSPQIDLMLRVATGLMSGDPQNALDDPARATGHELRSRQPTTESASTADTWADGWVIASWTGHSPSTSTCSRPEALSSPRIVAAAFLRSRSSRHCQTRAAFSASSLQITLAATASFSMRCQKSMQRWIWPNTLAGKLASSRLHISWAPSASNAGRPSVDSPTTAQMTNGTTTQGKKCIPNPTLQRGRFHQLRCPRKRSTPVCRKQVIQQGT